jgi:hypothetical protein
MAASSMPPDLPRHDRLDARCRRNIYNHIPSLFSSGGRLVAVERGAG